MKSNYYQFNSKILFSLIHTTVLLTSCSIASSNKVKNVIEIDAWQYNKTDLDFNNLSMNAVKLYGQELINFLPKDIKDYCPKYKSATKSQKIKFWATLISGLSYFESTHSPDVLYKEKFKNAQGRYVVSRGLLQISIVSSKGYQCNITDENQLHQPQVNLHCGVKILNKLIRKDSVIASKKSKLMSKNKWLGAAKYWSPFRDSKKLQIIQENTLRQPYCQ